MLSFWEISTIRTFQLDIMSSIKKYAVFLALCFSYVNRKDLPGFRAKPIARIRDDNSDILLPDDQSGKDPGGLPIFLL